MEICLYRKEIHPSSLDLVLVWIMSKVQETRAGDIGIRVAGTVRAKSEGAERQDRGDGNHAGSCSPVRLGIPCHHPTTDRQPDEGVYVPCASRAP